MRREKRRGDLKIYSCETVEAALRELADREEQSLSTYCYEVLREHVALRIVQQKIEGFVNPMPAAKSRAG